MSRKYLNDRWCVRCGKCCPNPYLIKNLKQSGIESCDRCTSVVLDIGCGNGRNSKYMKSLGFKKIISLDMAGDFGTACVLGVDKMPVADNSVKIILCNYLLMFLSDEERGNVLDEIQRISSVGCVILVELYPAKDSYAKTKEEMMVMLDEIYNHLGWDKIKYARAGGKFIAVKK